MKSWSVPASVLLAGEYAITREGGIGIALAVAPRAVVRLSARVTPESVQRFRRALYALESGKMQSIGGLRLESRAGAPEGTSPPILPPVLREITNFIRHTGYRAQGELPTSLEPTTIVIDTSRFFDPATGLKLGFGSSGAAMVLLTAALLHLAGVDPLGNRNTLLSVAVRAHRAFQGGRGSGYDVACSTMGGMLRFIGGEVPRWERLQVLRKWRDEGLRLYTLQVGTPVSSTRAVAAFDRRFPSGHEAEAFLVRSNEAVDKLIRARTWRQLTEAVAYARDVSRVIGDAIGVPAELPPGLTGDDRSWTAKTSGAGDEQAIVLARSDAGRAAASPLPEGLRELQLQPEGFRAERDGEEGP